MRIREVVAPESSHYSVGASVESLRKDCYAVTLSIQNGTKEALPLNAAMFELTATPAMFLQLTHLSFGRSAFRMPSSIVPGGVGNGQLFFQMQPGAGKPESATLHVHLPDGDHQIVFDVL
jgi:hypothetical protein